MSKFQFYFWVVSILISLFYGFFAGRIWIVLWEKYKFCQRVYQFIFNLLGSLYGFALLYYLIYKTQLVIQNNNFAIIHWTDLVILPLAMMGTMGLLPRAMAALAQNIDTVIGKR